MEVAFCMQSTMDALGSFGCITDGQGSIAETLETPFHVHAFPRVACVLHVLQAKVSVLLML